MPAAQGGGRSWALRATTSLKRLSPSPSSCFSVWRSVQKRNRDRGEKTRWFLYNFHRFFFSPPFFPQRTYFAVHEEGQTLRPALSFVYARFGTEPFKKVQLPHFLLAQTSFTLLFLLLNIEQRKLRSGDWIVFAGETTGHGEHLS